MDNGYVKFDSLFRHFHLNYAFFITRAKENILYEVIDSREIAQSARLISDETIKLTGPLTSKNYANTVMHLYYTISHDKKTPADYNKSNWSL